MWKKQLLLVGLGIAIHGAASAQIPDPSFETGSNVTEPPAESPQTRFRGERESRVYKSRIAPHWFGDNIHFWYRNDLPGGKREFLVVDAIQGQRKPAFDHRRIADALEQAGVNNVQADRLALDELTFDTEAGLLTFQMDGKNWRCDLKTYEVAPVGKGELKDGDDSSAIHPSEAPLASLRTGPETEIRFVNQTDRQIELYWLTVEGERRSYGKLAAGAEKAQHTYAGHVWLAVDGTGQVIAAFEAKDDPSRAMITGGEIPRRGRVRAAAFVQPGHFARWKMAHLCPRCQRVCSRNPQRGGNPTQ